jgi:hypothetical protein
MEYVFTLLPLPGPVIHVKFTPFIDMSASPMRDANCGCVTPMAFASKRQPDSIQPTVELPSLTVGRREVAPP